MDDLLTLDHFKPHEGKLVRIGGTRLALVLERVEGDGKIPPGFSRAPFTVIFRGASGREAFVPEGAYTCEIEDGPTLHFHMMPVHTPAPGRQDYQAVFN